MIRGSMSNPWLQEVEAVEEKLEALKLTQWRLPVISRSHPAGIVRSTSGLLKSWKRSGRAYERGLRRAWQRALRQRTA